MPQYVVRMERERKVRHVDAETRTPHQAVAFAEELHRGWRATEVAITRVVAGRCVRCGVVMFEGDVDKRRPGREGLWCEEC